MFCDIIGTIFGDEVVKIDRLKKKEQILRNIQNKLELENRKQKKYQSEITQLKQRNRRKKIFQAGLLFEESGILDDYNREEVLLILKSLKKKGVQNGRK